MVIALVEHFLNEDDDAFFDKWLNKVKSVVITFSGFVSLKRLNVVTEGNKRFVLEIRFESFSDLKKWSSSKEHDNLVRIVQIKAASEFYSVVFEK